MGLFGCSHFGEWKKYGKKVEGKQQQVCKKCGKLRWKKVWMPFCSHKKQRLDRRMLGKTLVCTQCGNKRRVA